MTLDTYADVDPDAKAAAASKVEDSFDLDGYGPALRFAKRLFRAAFRFMWEAEEAGAPSFGIGRSGYRVSRGLGPLVHSAAGSQRATTGCAGCARTACQLPEPAWTYSVLLLPALPPG